MFKHADAERMNCALNYVFAEVISDPDDKYEQITEKMFFHK